MSMEKRMLFGLKEYTRLKITPFYDFLPFTRFPNKFRDKRLSTLNFPTVYGAPVFQKVAVYLVFSAIKSPYHHHAVLDEMM